MIPRINNNDGRNDEISSGGDYPVRAGRVCRYADAYIRATTGFVCAYRVRAKRNFNPEHRIGNLGSHLQGEGLLLHRGTVCRLYGKNVNVGSRNSKINQARLGNLGGLFIG
jgi:hypothetical protein